METWMENGETPLHEAALAGYRNVAEVLLAGGADVNAKVGLGRTPGWRPGWRMGWTPLRYAVECGHNDVVALLLAKGADAALADDAGKTPIDIAREKRWTETLKILTATR
jgi:ankyrin repeat protein